VSDDDPVLLDIEDDVATITLNKPEIRNALDREIATGIVDALDDLEDESIRCIVFEGEGNAFSAGGDIQAMVEAIQGDVPTDRMVRELERTTNAAMARVLHAQAPTVAKVDGAAVGAGANLALACDVQLASEHAKMGFVFREVGLSVDAGTSYLLPRVVGTNVAKELIYTGEIVDADRAAELGLVNHVYDESEYEQRCGERIERIATGPTVALRHSKRLVDSGLDKSFEQALRDEVTAQGNVFDTQDHEEGVEAFFENRDPEFEGR
jgi:enoyl-CoA hydratase/carnithine racemase